MFSVAARSTFLLGGMLKVLCGVEVRRSRRGRSDEFEMEQSKVLWTRGRRKKLRQPWQNFDRT